MDNSDVVSFIQKHPLKASNAAFEWQVFAKNHHVPPITDINQFFTWCEQMPHIDQDKSHWRNLWKAKMISDTLSEVKPETKPQPLEQNSEKGPQFSPLDALGIAMAPFMIHGTQILEDDKAFGDVWRETEKDWEEKWKTRNPDKKLENMALDKEQVDYRYGSLDNPDAPSHEKDTHAKMKDRAAKYALYESNPNNPEYQQYKNYGQYKKVVEKYKEKEKQTFKKPGQDHAYLNTNTRIRAHAAKRYQMFQEANKHLEESLKKDELEKLYGAEYNRLLKQVEAHEWDKFAQRFPEKSAAYAQQHQQTRTDEAGNKQIYNPIQEALTRKAAREEAYLHDLESAAIHGGPTPTTQVPHAPASPRPSEPVHEPAGAPTQHQPHVPSGAAPHPKAALHEGEHTPTPKPSIFSRIGKRLNTLNKINDPIGSAISSITKKFMTAVAQRNIIIAIIILITILVVAIVIANGLGGGFPALGPDTAQTSPSSTGPTGGNCPTQAEIETNHKTTPDTCKYFNLGVNIFGDITDQQIDTYINTYWQQSILKLSKEEFERRTKIIVDKSRQVGLNPVLFLGYWKSESAFADGMGCNPRGSAGQSFEQQVDCAVGIYARGSLPSQCAASRDANSPSCKDLKGIRDAHPDIYREQPVSFPIATFDDFAETYGSRAPGLEQYEGQPNYNCVNTYNILLYVATAINACDASKGTPGSLAQCKFIKSDQKDPGRCQDGSKTCDIGLPYKSKKLIDMFEEVSQKTSIPAALLAAVARIESTTDHYTLSDYTDDDVTAMEQAAKTIDLQDNIDVQIPGTQKALCPTSSSGALGIMQIEPQATLLAQLKSAARTFDVALGTRAHDQGAVENGAQLLGKSVNSLTLADYCDPKTSIYLAAGFLLKKISQGYNYGTGKSWNPSWTNDRKVIDAVVESYYGALHYGDGGKYSYGDDLWRGLQDCQKVQATSGGGPSDATNCPIKNGEASCGSIFTPVNGCGHCGVGYPAESTSNYCGYPGTKYAIDIKGVDFQDIYLPKVKGRVIKWTHVYSSSGTIIIEQIQGYAGVDPETGETYYIQLHHTKPGSGNQGTHLSGELGGKICGDGCGELHTHVQLGSGSSISDVGWYDTAKYFCQKP